MLRLVLVSELVTDKCILIDNGYNTARNGLARLDDTEIGRWTNLKKVKSILQERTDSYRLELTNQGSSCTLGNKASTECELVT